MNFRKGIILLIGTCLGLVTMLFFNFWIGAFVTLLLTSVLNSIIPERSHLNDNIIRGKINDD